MKTLTKSDIEKLGGEAKSAKRLRTALPIHEDPSDPIQRVIMVAQPQTYVAPHRHPDKSWEMILLINGALDLLFFSDDGVVEKRVSLSEEGDRLLEYPADEYHSAVIMAEDTLVLELKEGPYDPATAKDSPSWAPEEGELEADAFNARLRVLQPGDQA